MRNRANQHTFFSRTISKVRLRTLIYTDIINRISILPLRTISFAVAGGIVTIRLIWAFLNANSGIILCPASINTVQTNS